MHFDIEVDRAVVAATDEATAAERERIAAEIDPARLELLADDLRRWAKVLRGEDPDA